MVHVRDSYTKCCNVDDDDGWHKQWTEQDKHYKNEAFSTNIWKFSIGSTGKVIIRIQFVIHQYTVNIAHRHQFNSTRIKDSKITHA